MRIILLITTLAFAGIANAQAPSWVWAKSAGGNYYDYGTSVIADPSGNIYVTGFFSSPTITFGSITLTNADNIYFSNDIFIVKYDASGNVLWAKRAGGSRGEWANSIATDANGNIYVTGYFFSSTVTFGSTTLINASSCGSYSCADVFLVKYDAAGNAFWAKRAGGSAFDMANSVITDASGNSYVAGSFQSASITFGSTTLTNSSESMFLVKYDANGNIFWTRNVNGSDSEQALSITADALGGIYMIGIFESPTITFGSTILTSVGLNMFIAKTSSVILSTSFTNVTCKGGNNGSATAIVGSGALPYSYLWSNGQTTSTATVLTAGNYTIAVTDGNGCSIANAVTITEPSVLNVYGSNGMICYGNNKTICATANGGTSPYIYLWSNGSSTKCQTVSPVSSTNYSITVTDFNGCTATSYVTITVDSVPKPTITINGNMLFSTAASTYQWYLNGNPINGATGQFYVPLASGVYAVTVTGTNGCSATSDTVNFILSGIYSSASIPNIVELYPNPNPGTFTITTKEKEYSIIITNLLGEKVYAASSLKGEKQTIDLSSHPNGVYFLQIKNESGTVTKKIAINR